LHLGFVFGAPPEVVTERLNQCIGPERAALYKNLLSNADLKGEDRENALYDFFEGLQEANLLRSVNTDVTLDTSYFLYEKAAPFLASGTGVVELGCWTGGLASFIAEQHPQCAVSGVDRARKIIKICKALYRLRNLSFCQWDYRYHKPAAVQPADVLLCSLGTNYNCPHDVYTAFDSTSVRRADGYKCEKAEALRYFKSWRQAAKPGGVLFAVLRTTTFPRFLAFIDASHEAGWAPAIDEFAMVECAGNKECIPLFVFRAGDAGALDEDVALSHFTRLMSRTDKWGTVTGPAAMGIYRSLGNRHVLAKREVREQSGMLIVEELGICGSLGYLYRHNTYPHVDLTLLSRTLAEDLLNKFNRAADQQ
jgi:SAM-dependent methyltransferase